MEGSTVREENMLFENQIVAPDVRDRHAEREFWREAEFSESKPSQIDPKVIDDLVKPRALERAVAAVAAYFRS